MLDEISTAEQKGKAVRKDAAKGKNTYPVILGLEQSRDEARNALNNALDAIEPLGERGETLRAMARFVVERNH